MSIGSWDPKTNDSDVSLTTEDLKTFIEISQNNQLDVIDTQLSAEQLQQFAPLMTRQTNDWETLTAELNKAEIIDLIRFFTVAEDLPGWQAGEKSPVIVLAKLLRKRGESLEKSLLMWIREHSDNRFLPYGSL